jgi:hypothetical protein
VRYIKRIFIIIKAFIKASPKDKVEIIKYFAQKAKQNFIDYWFGYVLITPKYIHCIDDVERLYSLSVIVGKHRKGQYFSDIEPSNIQMLIDNIQSNTLRYFKLHVDLGCSAFQEYTFNKYQCKLLLKELNKLKEQEVYVESDD